MRNPPSSRTFETSSPREDKSEEPRPRPAATNGAFVTASHAVLFEQDDDAACDICGTRVPPDDDEGHAVPGRALYLSARCEQITFEAPPLCPGCATAVGVSAMMRLAVEEDEG